ncbi:MAG: nitroreductase family protein [Paludibacteraceae bacterium]|nr:nitroreductase family protein [Paludibacteraceae bacterium]
MAIFENFEALCQHRRSIRKYTSEPIAQEKIDYLLRCALMSPSAKRTCPWEFYVTQDTAKIRALSACKTYGAQMFDTATAAIVIALDPALCHNTWMADGGIAAEHILLAAAEQGIGACWCHIHERGIVTDGEEDRNGAAAFVRQLFGIGEQYEVLCAIALGYPDEEKNPYDPEKLKYDKIHKL